MISRLILNLHEHANTGILTEPSNRDSLLSIDDPLMTEMDGNEQNRILNHLRSLHS
jgi:hypothetical protein